MPEPAWAACPVTLWDVWGEQGHPVRATVSDMGPLLLGAPARPERDAGRRADLAFKIADDNGLLLLDLKDLRAMLQFVGDNAASSRRVRQRVSPASIGAIQRGLLRSSSRAATGSSASRCSTSTT
jgi:uncharacterized protein